MTILGLAMVSIAGTRVVEVDKSRFMSVDLVTTSETSQMRAGDEHAPKAEAPKPLVEKIGERKPVDTRIAKVVDKPEIVTASEQPPAPEEKKQPEKKEAEKKDAEPKKDQIAEALKKDQAKKPEPKKTEAKPPPKKQPTFNPNRIADLLDKRNMQRQAALGDTISGTPALGTQTGNSAQLAQSELDAFRRKLRDCWTPPPGIREDRKLVVEIDIRLKRDGTLESAPVLQSTHRDPQGRATADSAVRAIIQCQPYTMFSPAKHEAWKNMPLSFNPFDFIN